MNKLANTLTLQSKIFAKEFDLPRSTAAKLYARLFYNQLTLSELRSSTSIAAYVAEVLERGPLEELDDALFRAMEIEICRVQGLMGNYPQYFQRFTESERIDKLKRIYQYCHADWLPNPNLAHTLTVMCSARKDAVDMDNFYLLINSIWNSKRCVVGDTFYVIIDGFKGLDVGWPLPMVRYGFMALRKPFGAPLLTIEGGCDVEFASKAVFGYEAFDDFCKVLDSGAEGALIQISINPVVCAVLGDPSSISSGTTSDIEYADPVLLREKLSRDLLSRNQFRHALVERGLSTAFV